MTNVPVRLVLIEREREVQRLEFCLAEAQQGRGQVVFVQGPAGIGKTRLLGVATGHASIGGFQVLRARGSDLERHFPLGVVRQLFEELIVGATPEDHEKLLAGLAGYAAPVFDTSDGGPGGVERPDRSAAVVHGLYWLTCNLAERAPVLMAVDDAQWADSASLFFLDYLARRIERLPVGLVVTYRPGETGPEAELAQRIATATDGAVIELRRLTREATTALVRSLLGEDASGELCEACFEATGGNPLLVHELAAVVAEDGVHRGADGASRVGRLVPEAVARSVLVRLSRLGAPTVGVARAVAVLGPRAELRHVAVMAGMAQSDAADAVDALVSADILARGERLEFAHPLLGEAVYQDMGAGERMRAHAHAAELLAAEAAAPERVAAQLLGSEPAGSEWAVRALRSAAAEATARGGAGTAVRYLKRALEERPDGGDRPQLLLELGVAEGRSAHPEAVTHLAEAFRLSRDPGERARIAQQLAALYSLLGRFTESAGVLEDAIAALGSSDPELRFGLAAEAAVLAVTHREARQRLAPMLAEFRASLPALGDETAAAPLLAVMAFELTEADGTAEEVIGYAERAFADCRLLLREGAVVTIGTAALVLADRPARAEALLDAAISQARLRGSIQAVRAALTSRALARLRRGRLAEAEADARLALELSSHEQYDPVEPLKLAWLVTALIEQGRLAEADRLATPESLARHDPDLKVRQPLVDARAWLLLLRGRAEDARTQLDAQLRWQRDWGYSNTGLTTRALAAQAANALGDSEAARALATEELDAARSFGSPRALGVALRTMALVGAAPEIEYLRKSAAALEGSEARLELARTLAELGSALRRAGNRRAARDPLRRGLDLARACGGALIAESANAELLAAGARPRRQRLTGRDALTPSERRIAAMAEDGLSNRQIAQTLFLSLKTVEMHLGHVYQKLGIQSRSQLAGALRERPKT
jgi:DNA-binding CsgD family transcriptional regulator